MSLFLHFYSYLFLFMIPLHNTYIICNLKYLYKIHSCMAYLEFRKGDYLNLRKRGNTRNSILQNMDGYRCPQIVANLTIALSRYF